MSFFKWENKKMGGNKSNNDDDHIFSKNYFEYQMTEWM